MSPTAGQFVPSAIISRVSTPSPSFKSPRHIVIEGPIRVGKSTLARVLAEQLHARRIFDADDNPFLKDFYDEKPGSAFRAQMYFLYERHRRLLDTGPETNPAPIVSDFLFEKDKIFAYLNLDNEELKLYERYFEMLAPSVPAPDLVIYLQATPEVLRKRVSRKPGPAPTNTSSSPIQAQTCWWWTLQKLILWNATRTCRNCCAACASL